MAEKLSLKQHESPTGPAWEFVHPRCARRRRADMEEVEAYVTENGLIYMDTSAKTGKNVKEIFVAIAKKLPRSIRQRDADIIQDLRPDAAGEEKDKKASGGCCGGKGSGA